MLNLLKKVREVNMMLQSADSGTTHFSNLSRVLSEVMDCNVYIASRNGELLGYCLAKSYDCDLNIKTLHEQGTKFPEDFNKEINAMDETVSNRKENTPGCVYDHNFDCKFHDRFSTYVPIRSAGERLGTVVLARFERGFTIEDLILAEFSATVVGMEMMRIRNYQLEKESRYKNVVQMAIATLSYSEREAIIHIFKELEGNEGLLVASKIADRVGITRSVIVNALRKFESAGVIETKSLGMKGTFIRILNPRLLDELEKAVR